MEELHTERDSFQFVPLPSSGQESREDEEKPHIPFLARLVGQARRGRAETFACVSLLYAEFKIDFSMNSF